MSGEDMARIAIFIGLAAFGFLTVGTCSVSAGGCALFSILFGG